MEDGGIMFEFTYSIKFLMGNRILSMKVRAMTEKEALEKIGITKEQVISMKVIDGV